MVRLAPGQVTAVTDPSGRHVTRPFDEIALGLRRGEAGELHHLVDPEVAPRHGSRDAGESIDRMRGSDPATGLPVGHAVRDEQPLGHVRAAVSTPELQRIHLRDQAEELQLGGAHRRVRMVDAPDQSFFGTGALHFGAPNHRRSGERSLAWANMCSICQESLSTGGPTERIGTPAASDHRGGVQGATGKEAEATGSRAVAAAIAPARARVSAAYTRMSTTGELGEPG
jgi:hypothetical protein